MSEIRLQEPRYSFWAILFCWKKSRERFISIERENLSKFSGRSRSSKNFVQSSKLTLLKSLPMMKLMFSIEKPFNVLHRLWHEDLYNLIYNKLLSGIYWLLVSAFNDISMNKPSVWKHTNHTQRSNESFHFIPFHSVYFWEICSEIKRS